MRDQQFMSKFPVHKRSTVCKSKPFRKVECGICHRFIWPLFVEGDVDCSALSEYMEEILDPVMRASPFSQFGMTRFKSTSQWLWLIAVMDADTIGVRTDAKSREAQLSTQSMVMCVEQR